MSWVDGTRARLRLVFFRRAAESRINEEVRLHIEMETDRLVRESGLDRAEAERQARVAFGGAQQHEETLREGRGRWLAWLSGSSLDLKLGLRRFVKYPGLTISGVLGMSVAVAIAAVSFSGIYSILGTSIPLDEGDRLVMIQNIDDRRSDDGRRTHLHDLATWRAELKTIVDVGAFRTVDRNIITGDGRTQPARIAEMTASGFDLARVAPLVGRYVHESDERADAPAVVVIGYEVWQNRFAGRLDVVGQTLQLGNSRHTVIGVMPRGFAFPVNNRIWSPLRLNPAAFERGQAPSVDVFGRLAPNATIDDARRQATTIAQRLAATYPDPYQHIRPRILPYARAFLDSPQMAWVLRLAQFAISMLLVAIGTNVAILVYARTASRAGEIAVRTALGASRGRIVMQLFAEALVLSVAASAVGLGAARLALTQLEAFVRQASGEQIPFWLDVGISPAMVVYVAGLAILGAVVVGVVPALKATRSRVHASLQQLSAGSSMQLGRTWTVLIVAQVAVSVVALPIAIEGSRTWVREGLYDPDVATKEFITASVSLDRPGASTDDPEERGSEYTARHMSLLAALVQRIEADRRVANVVFTSAIPGSERWVPIEVEGGGLTVTTKSDSVPGPGSGRFAGTASVDRDFFVAFDVPSLAGRSFESGDASPTATAVIVNSAFVKEILEGGNALGRRVRVAASPRDRTGESAPTEPWHEIVGIVEDFPKPTDPKDLDPKMYYPLRGADLPSATLAVRVRGTGAAAFADRLREIAASVDPMLRLGSIRTVDAVLLEKIELNRLALLATALVTLSVVLLSAAGVYALMSFTITRRRREIGLRAALGAGPRRVLWGVLSRAMGQIGIGIGVGTAVWAVLLAASASREPIGRNLLTLAEVAGLMAAVGLLATIEPARRALRIQPTEALKSE
jgi:putative ABC transport system permease protein